MEQKTVLIVEDDPNISDLVKIHLNDLGYKVDLAENGLTGLQKALEN